MRISSIVIAVLFNLLFGCKGIVEKGLEGSWSIDTIAYNGKDISRCFNLNVIRFSDDTECELPLARRFCVDGLGNYNAKWRIIQNDSVSLIIDSENSVFNGNYRIVFKRDENEQLLKMELTSKDLYLIARKGDYLYQEKINEIEHLEKITH